MKYPYLAAQLFNAPLMVRPETAEVFADAFVQILVGSARVESMPHVAENAEHRVGPEAFASTFAGSRFQNKRYVVTDNGIGILPIYGALAQRAGEITPDCTEMTSYQRLGRTFDAMVSDPDVRAILMEVDSPGGQVAGNFELGRKIMAARGSKPIWAHANEIAFSGGYSLAASAERLYVPDTGMVGSIGVIMLHMSQAERDAKSGYKYTAIYAGAHKNELNPHFDLSDAARARLQSMVDSSYQIFVEHVAAARGVDAAAVRATEASILEANPALSAKLIDGIATFAETLAALDKRLAGATTVVPGAGTAHQPAKETAMSETNKPAATDTPKSAEQQLNSPAPLPGGITEVQSKAKAEERTRVSGILALEEAKGRSTLAQHLATETEMSVDEAKKLLAKAPVEGAKGSGFLDVMRTTGNPPVAAGGGDDDDSQTMAKRIAAHVVPATNKAN